MSISEKLTSEIKKTLEKTAPPFTKDQIERRDKILNSDNPNFKGYGHKISEIEKIVKNIKTKYQCTYKDTVEVFKNLMSSDIHEEKFAAVFDTKSKRALQLDFGITPTSPLLMFFEKELPQRAFDWFDSELKAFE